MRAWYPACPVSNRQPVFLRIDLDPWGRQGGDGPTPVAVRPITDEAFRRHDRGLISDEVVHPLGESTVKTHINRPAASNLVRAFAAVLLTTAALTLPTAAGAAPRVSAPPHRPYRPAPRRRRRSVPPRR